MIEEVTVVIVTFQSDHIIKKTLEKLPDKINVIIVENSNRVEFKKKVEKLSKNITCILTGENKGCGKAINIGINASKTDYILNLNPDTFIDQSIILKLLTRLKQDKKIGAISTETLDRKNKVSKDYYYSLFSQLKKKNIVTSEGLIEVDFFIGHMFLSKKTILQEVGLFDENFFLNHEETDLLKRIKKKNYKICIEKNVFAKHLKGSSVNPKKKFEIDLCFKWHYYWGYIYYLKKHYGFIVGFSVFLCLLFHNILRLFYFFVKGEREKNKLVYFSILGLINSIFAKKSSYRPKIK